MKRWNVINLIIERFGYQSYLEIGVCDGNTLTKIQCDHKVGIEPDLSKLKYGLKNGFNNPNTTIIKATSDEFFAKSNDKFDVVFVDGDHQEEQVDKDSNETIGGVKTFTSIPVLPASNPTTANQAARKAYVDGVAQQGGATSTEIVAGISQLATTAEQAGNTFDANDPAVLSTKYASSTSANNYVIIADSSGELDPSFIADNNYTFTGSTTIADANFTTIPTTATTTPTLDSEISTKKYVDDEVKSYYYSLCWGDSSITNGDNHYVPIYGGVGGTTDLSDFHFMAVSTTTVDRMYANVDANSLNNDLILTFSGGTGDALSLTYTTTQTGDKNDTLTDTKTLTPGDKYGMRMNASAADSGSATDVVACVRLKIEED